MKTKGPAKTYMLDFQVTGRRNAVTWKSSDSRVVSVSKGKLTGKKAGTATVTMTANGVKDEVQVIVQDYTPTIALNQQEYTLYTKGKGTSVTLKASVDGASKKVEWKSNDQTVAEVNAKGKVTAKGKGRALITATANGMTAKCWVTVKEPKIIMEKNALVIRPQEKLNLYEYASIEVTGASQSVSYKSSNTKIASVSGKGVITAKKEGNVKITVKANGVEEVCDVTVSTCETHQFGEGKVVREAGCEENGLSEKECSVCHGKQQEVTEPLGHTYGKWSVAVKATENAAGLEIQKCVRCGEENMRTIPTKNKGEAAYGYKLKWEDDFDGTELDRASWNVELHAPGWVNEEWQEYVDSTDNIYVKDGNLVIQAVKTTKDGKDSYTSGRINTQNKHDYQYGRFEVRAKVPEGRGFLPAFWMMPTDEGYYGQWPKCGEIDIMEVLGHETNTAYSTLHFGEPHTQKQGTYELSEGSFAEDFHVYACEWDPGEFRFYVDDQLFYTEKDWFTKREGFGETAYPAPYDQPFYMILNLAVGGSWVGNPDETTEFGDNAQLVVDYVRVYQKDEYETGYIDKPENEVQLRDPDESGNYIVNGDFALVEDLSKEDANWQLLLAGGGDAAAEIKDNALHITSKAAGTLNYSVQIVQKDLPIEQGIRYKLSYEAYADEARTMITDISAPDRGYIRYLEDTTVELTTEKKTFTHIFDMKSNSDANGRVEFNLGNQGSTAAVHISNVRLEKDGEAEEDVKSVLPDGNYVYNGSFDEGNESGRYRLEYWDWDIAEFNNYKNVSISVTNDSRRELKAVVPETVTALDQVTVKQTQIAIKGGKKYVLSFEAYADQAKTIQSTIAGETFTADLTTERKEYRYPFTTAADLNGSELYFLLGTAGVTYIDNVSIREDGLIVNGDFSSGMTGYEVYVADDARVPAYIVDSLKEKDAFSIDIADTADADWKIQLKQNNIKLEQGKWYKISFDAKATKDRTIMYALQRDGTSDNNWMPYSGTQKIELTGEYQNFSHTFQMTEATDAKTILSISMGAVNSIRITDKHTVVIDNITLVETEALEEPPEVPEIPIGTELIRNGNFAQGRESWSDYFHSDKGTSVAEGKAGFTDQKARYEITNAGTADWNVQLKQEGLKMEKGASYKVNFKIGSSIDRKVRLAFMGAKDAWCAGEDISLTANKLKSFSTIVTLNENYVSGTVAFQISMGTLDGMQAAAPHAVEISDISVIKVEGGTTKDDVTETDVTIAPPTDGPGEGGDEPEAPEITTGTELIRNGDFAQGRESWTDYFHSDKGTSVATGKAEFTDQKARYEITNAGTADWNVQLKQEGLKMEKGASYKVNFKIGSSIDRNVRLAFMGAKDAWCAGEDISLTANKLKSFSTIVTLNENYVSGAIAFQISMGTLSGMQAATPHAVEISDISVIKVEGGTTADEVTETDVTIAPPTDGPGEGGDEPEVPEITTGTELIRNGNFAQGRESWSDYFHSENGASVAAGKAEFTDQKVRYEITNAGTADWNVQLKQEGLKMEKGASYKVNIKIASSIDRDVKLAFMGSEWCGGADISLKANKLKSFSTIVKLNDSYTSETASFQISLGNYETAQADGEKGKSMTKLDPHAIEIFEISITKVQEGTAPDAESESDCTVTQPGGSSGSGEKPSAENLIGNDEFPKTDDDWEDSAASPETEMNETA